MRAQEEKERTIDSHHDVVCYKQSKRGNDSAQKAQEEKKGRGMRYVLQPEWKPDMMYLRSGLKFSVNKRSTKGNY